MDDLTTRLRAAIDEQRDCAETWSCDGSGWPITALGDELLRMVAAHRKILDPHVAADDLYPGQATPGEPDRGCRGCGWDAQGFYITPDVADCPVVHALAEGYGIEP